MLIHPKNDSDLQAICDCNEMEGFGKFFSPKCWNNGKMFQYVILFGLKFFTKNS